MFRLKRPAILSLAFSCAGPALAQPFQSELDCDSPWMRRNGEAHCEIRELTMPPADLLSVDAGSVGSVRVSGWDRDDISVRAQVIAWARDEAAAREAAEEIVIRTDGGLRAERSGANSGSWAVSYEIRAPRGSDIRVEAANGAVTIADIAGELDVGTTNGRIALAGVSNTAAARSTNGAIGVTLADQPFAGESIDIAATNGAVTLRVPEAFAADLDVRTGNGGIRVGFPVGQVERARNRLDATIGSGGLPVRVRTTNGAVRIDH